MPRGARGAIAWTIGLHDQGWAPWAVVLAYLIAAACCVWAWRVERRLLLDARSTALERRGLAPRLWLVSATLLVMLAVNKELDLHVLLTDLGRRLSRTAGWYDRRRAVQLAFAICLAAGAAGGLVMTAHRLRNALARYTLAFAGMWLLALFIGLRVISFHHVDAWFGRRLHGVKLHWLIELVSIVMILAGAVRSARATHRGD
jgi:hypothetical protein